VQKDKHCGAEMEKTQSMPLHRRLGLIWILCAILAPLIVMPWYLHLSRFVYLYQKDRPDMLAGYIIAGVISPCLLGIRILPEWLRWALILPYIVVVGIGLGLFRAYFGASFEVWR
jgi:hypothetical protein